MIIDEAALYSPPLGQALLRWRASGDCGGLTEGRLHLLASIAGTAAHVFKAAARMARDKGLFASSLMGFREIQESLAGLASGVELLRLGACRVCRLLDQGRRDRGEAESALLYTQAMALLRDARSVAAGLLGAAWLTDNIPGDEPPSPNERNAS
jgi:alkylation response protein AidB-like acyl-CoA dehydrogenase